MKRRQVLSVAALGIAGATLPATASAYPIDRAVRDQSAAALLPLRVEPVLLRTPMVQAVKIGRAFPDPGATEPGRLSLELGMDVDGSSCRVICWEQVRVAGAVASPAAGVFMPFVEGRLVDLHVTTKTIIGKCEAETREWRSVLAPGTWLVAARRRSTGLPPSPEDVHMGATGMVELRNGKPVDFDSVLLVAL